MKCLVLITAYLCSLRLNFFSLNLDNWLIKDSSLSEVEICNKLSKTCEAGFIINYPKSHAVPSIAIGIHGSLA